LSLESRPFDLHTCIECIIVGMRYRAQKQSTSLSLKIDNEVPIRVIGDSTRLSQVLINLVGNALKFTEANGRVDISVSKVLTQEALVLKFVVADTGIGIPESSLDMLFKRFSQVDNSSARRYDGTGLGLCISKSIVEEMGGSIYVESVEGSGSTFTFTCQLQLDHEKVSQNTLEYHVIDFKPNDRKVLVAEDNAINRNVMQRMLDRIGFTGNIIMAQDGQEAFDLFKSNDFAAVLMDCNMPHVDGLSSTKMIRNYERENGRNPVPIIAVTASATKTQRLECFSAGMNEFITKPVIMSSLREMLQRLLENT
jgi:CheY-like chemotaxis protein